MRGRPGVSMLRLTSAGLIALAVAAMACFDSPHPSEPIVPPLPPAPAPPPPPVKQVEFPKPSSAATIYVDPDGRLYEWIFSMHGGSLPSRFVIYDSGTLALQFASPVWGFFEYPASRSGPDAEMKLSFSSDSRWDATASLRGDSLHVMYNDIMIHSDFTDGVYVRSERIQ